MCLLPLKASSVLSKGGLRRNPKSAVPSRATQLQIAPLVFELAVVQLCPA